MTEFIEYDVVPHHISKRSEATLTLDTGINVVKCERGAGDGTGMVRFYGPDGSLHEMGVPGGLFDALKSGGGLLRVRLEALEEGEKRVEPEKPQPSKKRQLLSERMIAMTIANTPGYGYGAVPENRSPNVSRDSILWAIDELDARLAKLEGGGA